MRYLEELSNHEIAERLAVSDDVVCARASRALRALGASEQLQAAVEMLEE